MYGRQGVELANNAGRLVGAAAFALRPIFEQFLDVLKGSDKLFADERRARRCSIRPTKTKTGQLWAYARDDRPWGGPERPGVAYVYEPDRKHQASAGACRRLRRMPPGRWLRRLQSAGRGQRGYAGFLLGARVAKLLRHAGREPRPRSPSRRWRGSAAYYAIERDIRGLGASARPAAQAKPAPDRSSRR